jgi:hypothetical protein
MSQAYLHWLARGNITLVSCHCHHMRHFACTPTCFQSMHSDCGMILMLIPYKSLQPDLGMKDSSDQVSPQQLMSHSSIMHAQVWTDQEKASHWTCGAWVIAMPHQHQHLHVLHMYLAGHVLRACAATPGSAKVHFALHFSRGSVAGLRLSIQYCPCLASARLQCARPNLPLWSPLPHCEPHSLWLA